MFDGIFEAIEEWMRGLLTGMVESNLTTMFTDVNEKTGEIAAQVGQTPQGWNGSIFSLIQNLSDSVIVPIAGMIITFVLCYELISMFTEKTDDGVYKVQGAAVSIDNSTGKVAAIVGGREEDQEGYGLNRAYQSFRQPGSAIKPLLVLSLIHI